MQESIRFGKYSIPTSILIKSQIAFTFAKAHLALNRHLLKLLLYMTSRLAWICFLSKPSSTWHISGDAFVALLWLKRPDAYFPNLLTSNSDAEL